jgi:hypothetical protein
MRKYSKGFVLLETALMMGITLYVAALGATVYLERVETNRAIEAGDQLGQFNTAVQKYIRASYGSLTSGTTIVINALQCPGGVTSATCVSLKEQKYLGQNFPPINTYGGQYSASVQVVGNQVQALTALNMPYGKDKYIGEIIKWAGARAGSLSGNVLTANKGGFSLSNVNGFSSVTSNTTIGALASTRGEQGPVYAAVPSTTAALANGSAGVYTSMTYSPPTGTVVAKGTNYIVPNGNYNPAAGFSCNAGYTWNGTACVNPCAGTIFSL